MTRRIVRGLLVALIIAGGVGWQRPRVSAQGALPPCGVAMRILVVSANGNNPLGSEADLPAITTALEYVGTPYDVFVTNSANPLTLETAACATALPSETVARGLYQGIILTNNLAAGAYAGQLADYEKKFGIRQVTWFNTWPSPDEGFNWPSSTTNWNGPAVTAHMTAEGAATFPYIRTGDGASPILIQYGTIQHATPLDASTVPLLTDDATPPSALAAIHTYADGRQNLVMTFDSNPYLLHSLLLSYGVVNWVTQGLFIGERHTYISPQVDDIFIDDEQWTVNTACGTSVDNTAQSHRMTGADLTAMSNWQALKRQNPLTPDLKITMAFNGFGTSPDYTFKVVGSNDTIIGGSTGGAAGLSSTDTLTLGAIQQQQNYFWTSHTYDHENLDHMNYTDAGLELSRNVTVATQLGLDDFTTRFMVQPDVSGLANAEFLRAAYDNGIRYVLSNTSKTGQNNPTPNTGYWNTTDPRIFVIPRRANNLFFNVATPDDWAKEYNCIYAPGGSAPYAGFTGPQTYDQILDFISNELLADLLRGELDPWMFHQTNLAAFTAADGTTGHTLLGDLLDRTFEKYASYMTFPIVSPSIDTLAVKMKDRTTIRTKGIDATIKPGVSIVFSSPADVTVPVTGLKNGAELYAGQWISWVPLTAGVAATVPLLPPFVSEASTSSDGTGIRTATVSTTQPGDLVLAFVGAGGSAGQTATVSGAGLSWTLVKRQNSQAGTAEIWAAYAPTRLTNAVVTSTLAQAGDQSLTVVPFAGAGSIGTFNGTSGGSGGPSVPLTTTKRSSLIYAIGNDPTRAVGRTLGANQWMVHQFVDAKAADTFWVQALSSPVPNAGTAVRLYDTAPKKDDWNFAAVEIVPAPKPTTVPAVVNMTQASATSSINAAGLYVGTVKYELNLAVPGGTVMSQNPTGGTAVMTETKVDLVVSTPRPVANPVVATTTGGAARVSVPATTGQLLVAFVSSDGPSGSAQTVTVSGGGLTWTRVARANAQKGTAEIWRAKATANTTVTVTSTEGKGGSYGQTLAVVAFSGAGSTGASQAASSSSGAPTASLTTTKPYSLVYGVGFDSVNASARTLGSGQVMVYEFVNPNYNSDFWVQARDGWIPASGTTVQVNDTAPTGVRWNFAAVEIAVP